MTPFGVPFARDSPFLSIVSNPLTASPQVFLHANWKTRKFEEIPHVSLDHRGVGAGIIAARDWAHARDLALAMDRLPPLQAERTPWFWCRARTLALRSKWRPLTHLGKGQATGIAAGTMGAAAAGVVGLGTRAWAQVRKDMRRARLRTPGMTHGEAWRRAPQGPDSFRAGASGSGGAGGDPADPFRSTGRPGSLRASGDGRGGGAVELAQHIERAESMNPRAGAAGRAQSFGGLTGAPKLGSKKVSFAEGPATPPRSPKPPAGPTGPFADSPPASKGDDRVGTSKAHAFETR